MIIFLNSKLSSGSDIDLLKPRYPIQLISNATQLRAEISCNMADGMTDVSGGFNRQHDYPYWKVRMLRILAYICELFASIKAQIIFLTIYFFNELLF